MVLKSIKSFGALVFLAKAIYCGGLDKSLHKCSYADFQGSGGKSERIRKREDLPALPAARAFKSFREEILSKDSYKDFYKKYFSSAGRPKDSFVALKSGLFSQGKTLTKASKVNFFEPKLEIHAFSGKVGDF